MIINSIKRRTKQVIGIILAFLVAGAIASCSKMDDYKKFIKGGEISYTGKLDSVRVMSGKYRVLLKGLFIADPKVKKCVVYWSNKADSVVIPVNRTANVDTLNFFIEHITEGVQNFLIYTYDAAGNRSIPVYKTGRVYGDRYQGTLMNRGINEATTNEDGQTLIRWSGMDRVSGVFATEVIYKDKGGADRKIRIPIDSNVTELKNFKLNSNIQYRTLFLPDTLSVDTFYTSYTERYVPKFIKTDVTRNYLKNTGPNMSYSSINSAGRWGILADWISNASVKNASGFGGYEKRSGVGYISMEAGWGLVNVPNGLIYQTLTLPAGTYSFEISGLDQNTGGSRYIAVAAGATLPDVANITSRSIAFSILDTKILTFTLSETQQVSIGFGGNLTGTSSTGQYFKIGTIKLYSITYL